MHVLRIAVSVAFIGLVAVCAAEGPAALLARQQSAPGASPVADGVLFEQAVEMMRARAAQGDAEAMTTLGVLHTLPALFPAEYSTVVARDSARGAALLARAGARGSARAVAFSGMLHWLRRDYGVALGLYEAAAEMGEPNAQVAAAGMYAAGQGTEPNAEAALAWYERALAGDDAFGRRQAARDLRAKVHHRLIPSALAREALRAAQRAEHAGAVRLTSD